MAASTRRYAAKKNLRKKSTADSASRGPFDQIMRNLLPLVGLLRQMSQEVGAAARDPKLIVSASGLEVCFSDAVTPPTQSERASDRLTEMERSLKMLTATVDSLSASLKLNEEMLEALVDSLIATDDLSFGQPDPALGPKTLAS